MSTDDVILVDSQQIFVAKLSLMANFGTSGNNNTGTVTYVDPYTILTGLTTGIEWNESNIGYNLYANQKDAYIYANGTIDYYIFVDGLLKFGSDYLALGRVCYLAR
jgi:hypothetical protein